MTKTPTPASHAVNTAPISAGLRGMEHVEEPDFDLSTAAGGRGYVAWYFANVVKRHDFTRYLNDRLAYDFACTLASHLQALRAAASPGQHDAPSLQAAPPAPTGVAVPDGWMENLGFELDAPADGVWMVIDDTGARREAGLVERVLWKELVAIRAALAAAPAREHATQLAAHGQECGNCFEGKSDFDHTCRKCGGTGAAGRGQEDARVQWWLAAIDMHGNPTLADGAHSDRAGADKAAYLIDALGVGGGKKYAVARVELSEPRPSADGVNQEAVAQCNHAARAAQGSDKP